MAEPGLRPALISRTFEKPVCQHPCKLLIRNGQKSEFLRNEINLIIEGVPSISHCGRSSHFGQPVLANLAEVVLLGIDSNVKGVT